MDYLFKPLIAKFEKKLELISNDVDFLCNRTQEIDEKLATLTTLLQSLARDRKPSRRPQSPPSKSAEAHAENTIQSHSIEST